MCTYVNPLFLKDIANPAFFHKVHCDTKQKAVLEKRAQSRPTGRPAKTHNTASLDQPEGRRATQNVQQNPARCTRENYTQSTRFLT